MDSFGTYSVDACGCMGVQFFPTHGSGSTTNRIIVVLLVQASRSYETTNARTISMSGMVNGMGKRSFIHLSLIV
jgi:ABC-type polysaccharide/polyol phosphate transport system ATPase subunit